MAVKIPTFADLGFNDPRAVGGLPQYPGEDPGAAGLAAFGKGVATAGGAALDYAAEEERKRSKLEEALATADLAGDVIRRSEALKVETDPEKITQLRAGFSEALNRAAQGISSDYRRKLWAATHSKTVAEGEAQADLRNTAIYRDRYAAGIDEQAADKARLGASASDPMAFDVSLQAVRNLYGSAEEAGVLTAEQALRRRRAAEKQLVVGRVGNLINRGDPAGAVALLDRYGTELEIDAGTIETLRRSAETRGHKLSAIGAVDEAMGMVPRASSGGGSAVERFLNLTERLESGGQNIPQRVVGPNGGYNPSTGTVTGPSTAQGYFQITNTTWGEFAPQAGVDLGQYPNAMSAPYEVQRKVARTIATTSGVQHWTDYNKALRAAVQKEGLPVSGPVRASPIPTDVEGVRAGHIPTDTSGARATLIPAVPGRDIQVGRTIEETDPALAADINAAPAAGEPIPLDAPAPAPTRVVPAPSYFQARENIMRNPNLMPAVREEALDQLAHRFARDSAVIRDMETRAKENFANQQKATAASLLARAIRGEALDSQMLAGLVETQQITDDQYRAVQTEAAREGRDDPQTYSEFSRRAYAGEDISTDLWRAIAEKRLKGSTAEALQRTANARRERGDDQIERAAYATLRTAAGMDAQERPMIDFDKAATANQLQLWSLAQQEWNRRVLVGRQDETGRIVREDPNAVLADMLPRYSRPVERIEAFPKPRMGAVTKLEDIPALVEKTYAAHARGVMTDVQLAEEELLIAKLEAILEAQKKRTDAAAAAPKPAAGDNAGRGRLKAQ